MAGAYARLGALHGAQVDPLKTVQRAHDCSLRGVDPKYLQWVLTERRRMNQTF